MPPLSSVAAFVFFATAAAVSFTSRQQQRIAARTADIPGLRHVISALRTNYRLHFCVHSNSSPHFPDNLL